MRKLAIVVAGGLAMAMAFSGCFVMRTLSYSHDPVKAGEEVKALISVSGDTEGSNERPFFWFSAEGGSHLKNDGKFDTEEVFDGPKNLKKNPALVEAAREDCEATLPAARRGPLDATAVTTHNPFVAPNGRKFMDAKVPIKASETGSIDGLAIFMGTWTDDGDDVPEDEDVSDDEYDCQPPYVSAIRIKDGAPVR